MTRPITPQTTLENLKKEAKRRQKELPGTGLRVVQHTLALEFGFAGWTELKKAAQAAQMDRLAEDLVTAYATGEEAALQRINRYERWTVTVDDLRALVWRLIYKVRQAGGDAAAFGMEEARELIARTSGFHNWTALIEGAGQVSAYSVESAHSKIAMRRSVRPEEWESISGVMQDRRITAIEAHGYMTDDALKRIAQLGCVTSLKLSGSREISDQGLMHLARMPQLEFLDLSEHPGGKLTDRGLEVLRHLPNLRTFNMCWQSGISDAGAANLRFCEKIETVNVMGTFTGDGVVEALRGKSALNKLQTGRLLTDAGLTLLRELPRFHTWQEGAELLIDGPFTSLASLADLKGITALDLFWHVTGIASDAFEVLRHLAHLEFLGCDGELCNDQSMRHIAAIPRLRKLRAQGSLATDEGFIALSRCSTLERFWGREAPHLTGRGFTALSALPSLKALGVSCKNVDDIALAALPDFPALEELTTIDIGDDGFRHVGRCLGLRNLSCMYCRDTTDIATGHIASLALQSYYAGLTQITDRSLEILGRIPTLERIELYETKRVTGAGLLHLKTLPHLRELRLSGLPEVTWAATAVFPRQVTVEYNV